MFPFDHRWHVRHCWLAAGLVLLALAGLVALAVAELGGDGREGEFQPVNEFRASPSLSVVLAQVGFLVIPVLLVWLYGAIAIARQAYAQGASFWRYLALGLALSPVTSARRLRLRAPEPASPPPGSGRSGP